MPDQTRLGGEVMCQMMCLQQAQMALIQTYLLRVIKSYQIFKLQRFCLGLRESLKQHRSLSKLFSKGHVHPYGVQFWQTLKDKPNVCTV
jgi:hypothetical protein